MKDSQEHNLSISLKLICFLKFWSEVKNTTQQLDQLRLCKLVKKFILDLCLLFRKTYGYLNLRDIGVFWLVQVCAGMLRDCYSPRFVNRIHVMKTGANIR